MQWRCFRACVVLVAASGCGGALPVDGAAAGTPSAVAQVRLFDPFGREITVHTALPDDQSLLVEVRLYDSTGVRRINIPGGVQIVFRFDPDSLAHAQPILGQPFWQAVTPTAAVGTDGSLFVSVLFLADSTTKTYRPIQVLVH